MGWRLCVGMRHLFAIVAAKAATQQGRITTRQLREAGVDAQRTKRWVDDGLLHRVHRGVYAVGHRAPSALGDYVAATLACEGSALSHAANAHVLRLLPGGPPKPEVTVPTVNGLRRPGIVIHRVKVLHPLDVAELDGIRVTTVPRTLLDLAPRLSHAKLVRACHEAWVRHDTTAALIEACIERNPRKPGVAKLRAALGSDATLSALEDGFLDLLRAHGIPLPRTNVRRGGDKVDCYWPELDLTVELLSYRFHASRQAFEQDVARRRRSNHLAFTWGDVFERGARTVAELRAAMAQRR